MVSKHLARPSQAILDSKKKKHMGKTIGYLVLSAILAAIGAALGSAKASVLVGTLGALPVLLAIGVFIMVVVGALVIGWLVTLVANILGGKGHYYEGLTSVTNAIVAPSVGILVAAILSFIPYVGLPLVFLTLAITLSMGIAGLYRSVKELFTVDMITAFVVVSVLTLALIIALLGTTTLSLTSILPMTGFPLA